MTNLHCTHLAHVFMERDLEMRQNPGVAGIKGLSEEHNGGSLLMLGFELAVS